MRRLVYSPKAWAYIKGRPDNSGNPIIYDISPYIVSGQVNRVVNAVSSAEITFRNPNRIFTQLGNPAFLPMDPITIFLQRHVNKPVRVFTGWLDESPYYQMYPGTCTIYASCTLKKLQYTFWDPALPFVMSFLKDIGWAVDTSNGLLLHPSTLGGGPVIKGNISNTQLSDGSFGQLLYAVMKDVGGWDDNNIYIENLPKGIVPWITTLFKEFSQSEDAIKSQFTSLLSNIIGTGSNGNGGSGNSSIPTGGSFPNGLSQKLVEAVVCIANQYNIPASMVLATLYCESTFTSNEFNGSCCYGWMQFNFHGMPNDQSVATPYPGITATKAQAEDLVFAVTAFCQAAAKLKSQYGNNQLVWAQQTQGCGSTCYPAWDTGISLAQGALSKWGQNVNCSGGSSKKSNNSVGSAVSGAASNFTTAMVNNPNSKPTSGANTNSNGMINPIPGWTIGREDMGVDASAPAGTAVLAPADCTYIPPPISGWYPNLYLFKFDTMPPGAPSQYWYVAEGVTAPTQTHYSQGDTVVVSDPSLPTHSIEIGWGSPTTNSRTLDGGANAHPSSGATTPYGSSFKNYFSVGGGSPVKGGSAGSGGGTGAGVGGSTQDPFSIAKGVAFATELQWPSIAETIEAVALQGHKALMNDVPLMNFVQQVCSATMRSFQSAPNGDFYAFFPDYFGEFNHRPPYWKIDDVEVMTGDIQLTDSNLITHMYVVGDTLMANEFPNESTQLLEKVLSAGTVDIFDYFGSKLDHGVYAGSKTGGYNQSANQKPTPLLSQSLHEDQGAYTFLNRYGARPVELDQPLIRSQLYEAFVAVQQFMLAWSMQFATDFSFTFMPELYPGGRVEFGYPHYIDMYINSVTHSFDYENGFTTTAELTAPAASASSPLKGTAIQESPSWGMVNSITQRSPGT